MTKSTFMTFSMRNGNEFTPIFRSKFRLITDQNCVGNECKMFSFLGKNFASMQKVSYTQPHNYNKRKKI